MNRVGGIALLLFASCCSSCSVGPDFKELHPPVPDKYVGAVCAGDEPCASAEPSTLATWWQSFEDPELDKLVAEAESENLDLLAAKTRILQARAVRAGSVAGLLPTVDLSADYRRSHSDSGGRGNSVDSSLDTSTETDLGRSGGVTHDAYQAGVDASWEIDLFGGNRRAVEAAEADLEAAVDDANDVRVVLAADIASGYFDLRRLDEQIEITTRNISNLSDVSDLTQRKRAAGLVNGLDESSAKAQLLNNSAELPRLKDQRQAAVYNLALLLGREPGALLDELQEPRALPAVPEPPQPGTPADLLLRRPDIRRAAARVHAATARVGVAESDFYPKLSLSGLLTWEGATFSSVADGRSSIWSFGPALQWPLFDGGRIAANVQLQDAASREALLQYQQTVLAALNEVEQALSSYQHEGERILMLSAALAETAKSVDISNRLYRAGMADFINVLISQRALFAAQQALLDSRRSGLQYVTTLYKALGGGWEFHQQ